MLVKNWMSKKVVTIDECDSMQNAMSYLKEHKIDMLPVTKRGYLVGVITDRDLKKASPSDATSLEIHEIIYIISKIKVKDIMTKKVITVPLDCTIEETAKVLLDNKISGVPVLDKDGNIAGIITKSDVFRLIILLTGLDKKGVQMGFELEDKPGSIKEITDIVRERNGRMISILTSYENAPERFRKVYMRFTGIEGSNLQNLKNLLKQKKIKVLYTIDYFNNERDIL